MTNTDKNDFNATIGNTVLGDGFLVPMTDFVIKMMFSKNYPNHKEALKQIFSYAELLKQPLKLEMFVPCDEDGNLWEYPPTKEEWEWAQKDSADAEQSFKQKEYYYEKAKEKILFEGFKPYEDYECAKYEEVYVDEEVCDGKFTVEDLIKDVGKTKIKLSQTALNAIFG